MPVLQAASAVPPGRVASLDASFVAALTVALHSSRASTRIVRVEIAGPGINEEFQLQNTTGVMDIDQSIVGTPQVVPTNSAVQIEVSLGVSGALLTGGFGNPISNRFAIRT